MPLQAISYRLYHTPFTGPDLRPRHLSNGFGRRSRPQRKLGRAALMRGQEKEDNSPCAFRFCYWGSTSVALSIRAVRPSRSARAQRAQRAQLLASAPVHRVRASRVNTCDGAINASAKYNTEPCLTRVRANKLSYHVAQWRESRQTTMQTAKQAGNNCMSSWVHGACKHKVVYKIKQR